MLGIYKSIISCLFITVSLYTFGYIVFGKSNKQDRKKSLDIIALIISIVLYTFVHLYLKGLHWNKSLISTMQKHYLPP